MLLYIDENRCVYGYNEIISKQEALEYINDVDCIWVDGLVIKYPSFDIGTQYINVYLNEDMTVRYEIVDIVKEILPISEHEELVRKVYINSETSSFDNLINMDMIIAIDEKLNKIMEHLGL